eukprot:TRINITY_DN2955_c3_g1_i1.p1 TRINITY_DN2955_c3_g1~~TRINITY_DN2955_c3_g1_i1.p1  ORF type:complete len:561 (+),score=131.34 TRINITY_DN2955_c3_g1_i1:169-1683(+)
MDIQFILNDDERLVDYNIFFRFLTNCIFHTYDEMPNLIVYLKDSAEELLFHSLLKIMSDWCYVDEINNTLPLTPPNFILKNLDDFTNIFEHTNNDLPILYTLKTEEIFENFQNNPLLDILNIEIINLDVETISNFKNILKLYFEEPLCFFYGYIHQNYTFEIIEKSIILNPLQVLLTKKPEMNQAILHPNPESNHELSLKKSPNTPNTPMFKAMNSFEDEETSLYGSKMSLSTQSAYSTKPTQSEDDDDTEAEEEETKEDLTLVSLLKEGYLSEGINNWMFSDVLAAILFLSRGNNLNLNYSSEINSRYLRNLILHSKLDEFQKDQMSPNRRKVSCDSRFSTFDEIQALDSERNVWTKKFLSKLATIVSNRYKFDKEEKNIEMLQDLFEVLEGHRSLPKFDTQIDRSQFFEDNLTNTQILELLGCDGIYDDINALHLAGAPFLSTVLPTAKHVREGKYNLSLGISLTSKGLVHFAEDLFIIAGKRIHQRRKTTFASYWEKYLEK